jgi:hypothetical protein
MVPQIPLLSMISQVTDGYLATQHRRKYRCSPCGTSCSRISAKHRKLARVSVILTAGDGADSGTAGPAPAAAAPSLAAGAAAAAISCSLSSFAPGRTLDFSHTRCGPLKMRASSGHRSVLRPTSQWNFRAQPVASWPTLSTKPWLHQVLPCDSLGTLHVNPCASNTPLSANATSFDSPGINNQSGPTHVNRRLALFFK